MSELLEMLDFDEMSFVDSDFEDITAIENIRDIDIAIMEEALARFVDDIVLEERSIA